jgi:hypothetical protein
MENDLLLVMPVCRKLGTSMNEAPCRKSLTLISATMLNRVENNVSRRSASTG